MAHVTWYTAMSMDGRIAGAGDDLAFLQMFDEALAATGEFDQFLTEIDACLVGAGTLRWLLDQGHGWPHDDLPTWLVSHDQMLVERVGVTRAPLVRCEGDVGAIVELIDAAGHERVWLCGGGDVAGQLLAAGNIDEVVATVAPTVLGQGPSLFDATLSVLPTFDLVEACVLGTNAARLRWTLAPGS